jgi:hypothetical protein
MRPRGAARAHDVVQSRPCTRRHCNGSPPLPASCGRRSRDLATSLSKASYAKRAGSGRFVRRARPACARMDSVISNRNIKASGAAVFSRLQHYVRIIHRHHDRVSPIGKSDSNCGRARWIKHSIPEMVKWPAHHAFASLSELITFKERVVLHSFPSPPTSSPRGLRGMGSAATSGIATDAAPGRRSRQKVATILSRCLQR